jgi:hypothetical protein
LRRNKLKTLDSAFFIELALANCSKCKLNTAFLRFSAGATVVDAKRGKSQKYPGSRSTSQSAITETDIASEKEKFIAANASDTGFKAESYKSVVCPSHQSFVFGQTINPRLPTCR